MEAELDREQQCPDCGEETSFVKLGDEPTREICGRFGCGWDGKSVE